MAKGRGRRGRRARSRGNGTGISSFAQRHSSHTASSRPLHMEELEDRRMLAVFEVNQLGDLDQNGNTTVGSLRQAIELSNASGTVTDTIVFVDDLFDEELVPFSGFQDSFTTPFAPVGSITLFLDAPLAITDDVTIIGPGAGVLTVAAGAANMRIFNINDGNDNNAIGVNIAGLSISGGNLSPEGQGGAISNNEALALTEVIVANNSAALGGGGIFNTGSLTVERSLIMNNSSGRGGGGILNSGEQGNVNVIDSTITGNSANGPVIDMVPTGYGGGIYNIGNTVNIQGSTIFDNTAAAEGGGVASLGFDPELEEIDMVPPLSSLDDQFDDFEDQDFAQTGMMPPLDFEWITSPRGSDAPWVIDTVNVITGGASASSALIDPGQDSSLELVVEGNGTISFGLAITGDVILNFYINEVLQNSWAVDGTTDTPTFDVRGGISTLRWEVLDPAGMSGFATIDDVSLDLFDLADLGSVPANLINFICVGVPTVFQGGTTTNFQSSIIAGNNSSIGADDVASTGEYECGDMPAVMIDFEPQMNTRGGNLFGALNFSIDTIDNAALPGNQLDLLGVPVDLWSDPNRIFIPDPIIASTPVLDDYGGSIPVFLPDATILDTRFGANVAIDQSDTSPLGFDQRGRHFTRTFDGDDDFLAVADIGAAEVQVGNWVVDSLLDDSDGQYSAVWDWAFIPGGNPPLDGLVYEGGGIFEADLFTVLLAQSSVNLLSSRGNDFSLRESLEFAAKNPIDGLTVNGLLPVNTISFDPLLINVLDTNPATPQPTLEVSLGAQLEVPVSVNILGPTIFDLEIDATASDPTPNVDDGNGIRVFNVDDGDDLNLIDVFISDLTIMGSEVGAQEANGGGIFNRENLSLNAINIRENAATSLGAGIYQALGSLTVDNSAFFGNSTAGQGAGLYVHADSGPVQVSNTTFSGNFAGALGAGIYNDGLDTTILFSTITENDTSSTSAAGISNQGDLSVFGSIISGNFDTDIEAFGGVITSLGYNLVGDGIGAVDFIGTGDITGVKDPMLEPLRVAGGLTPTHEPMAGSPVIDAGDPNAVPGAQNDPAVGIVPLFDQRGDLFTRVEPSTGRIDIGAYELQGIVYVVDDDSDIDDGIYTPGNLSLREAITLSNSTPLEDTIVVDRNLVSSIIIAGNVPSGVPYDLLITDSVKMDLFRVPIQGLSGARVFTIDNGNDSVDLDVRMDNLLALDSFNQADRGVGVPNNVKDGLGGVIYNAENLTLNRPTLTNNQTIDPMLDPLDPNYVEGAKFHGGAIYHRVGELVIENGTFASNETRGEDADGGALYIESGNVSILDSFFFGNSTALANSDGGAIFMSNGDLLLDGVLITGNFLTGGGSRGGAIFSIAGPGPGGVTNVTATGTTIISGNAANGPLSKGAGMYNYNSNVVLGNPDAPFRDVIISDNSSIGNNAGGVGVYQKGGTLEINNALVAQHTADGNESHGVAIAGENADIVISKTRITDNNATGLNTHGAGVYTNGGSLVVRDSTLDNNHTSGAGSSGGAIYSVTPAFELGSDPMMKTSVINSTLSGNSASYAGGGIFNGGGLTEIYNSTITRNEVPSYGFGAGVGSDGTGNTTGLQGPDIVNVQTRVMNSIIAGNVVFPDLAADFNADNVVSGLDFLSWQRNFNKQNATKEDGDANGDTTVDNLDLDIFEDGYGDAPQSSDVDRVGSTFDETFVSLGFNVVGAGTSIGVFNQLGDQPGIEEPLLGDLVFNDGGDLPTHALLDGSVAIDAGDPNFDPTAFDPEMTEDGAGNPRIASDHIDVGAYEVPMTMEPPIEEASAVSSDHNGDGRINGLDFLAWQRGEAVSQVSAVQVQAATAAFEVSEEVAEPEPIVVAESVAAGPGSHVSSETVFGAPAVSDVNTENDMEPAAASSDAPNPFARVGVFFANLTSLSPEIEWTGLSDRSELRSAFEELAAEFESKLEDRLDLGSRWDKLERAFSRLGGDDGAGQDDAEDSVFEELGKTLV